MRVFSLLVFVGILMLLFLWLGLPMQAQEGPRVTRGELAAYMPALRQFVRQYGKASVNHIYIARVANYDGKRWEKPLYAYWKQDQSILLFEHFKIIGGDIGEIDLGWLHHKARIDLENDVVATREDVGSSTYLVDAKWANKIVNTCLNNGIVEEIHLKN